jgi:hypothetical protein
MDLHRLHLTFDESMLVSSLRPQQIILQSIATSAAISHALTLTDQSIVTPSDGTELVVQINNQDVNNIKAQQFCRSVNDTFISFSESMATDTAQNPVKSISNSSALQANEYIGDKTSPRLGGFSMFLDTSQIIMTFNEPVFTNSINFSAILLHNSRNSSAENLRLKTGTIVSTSIISTFVTIELDEADVVLYKSNPAFASSLETTFLSVDEGAAVDGSGLSSLHILQENALQASNYVGDQIPASLQSFTIDLQSRELILTFNEIMNVDSFSPELVRIQNKETIQDEDTP